MSVNPNAPVYTAQGVPAGLTPAQWQQIQQGIGQQTGFNNNIATGQLGVQQGQLGVQQGQLGVNQQAQQNTAWYNQQLVQQAIAALQQNQNQFNQNFGVTQAGVTGQYQGNPTMANQQFQQNFGLQQGALTGSYNGQQTLAGLTQQQSNALAQAGLMGFDANGTPTLAGYNQAFQNQLAQAGQSLQQAGVTGMLNGQQTLASQLGLGQLGLGQQTAEQQAAALTGNYQGNQTLASQLQQANLSGMYAGSPTMAAQNQNFNQGISAAGVTGQYNGQNTLAQQIANNQNQQAQGQLGLNTLQLGSQLSGPSNWLQYENAAAGARANPNLQQGVASWADMTNNQPTGTGAMQAGYQPQARTVGTMAQDFTGQQYGPPTGGGQTYSPQTGGVVRDAFGQPTYAPAQGEQATGRSFDTSTLQGGGQQNQQMYAGGGGTFNESGGYQQQQGSVAQPWQGFNDMAGAGGGTTNTGQYGVQQRSAAPMYGAQQQGQPNAGATANALSNIGSHPSQVAPGWWNSLNGDQQKMTTDAWSSSGQSPDTVLANINRNGVGQGFGRAA